MKNFSLLFICWSGSFITLSSVNTHFVIPKFYPSDEQIQQEIEDYQKEVIQFIEQIKTIKDLQHPLPIPSRANPKHSVPMLLDLLKKRRNAHLIEMIIAKKLPISHAPVTDNALFNHWIFKGKSKVIRLVCELHKKYGLNVLPLVNTYLVDFWTPLMAAVNLRKTASIKVLLDQGALVNTCTKEAQTALHIAAAKFCPQGESKRKTKIIVQLLCNAGIDLDLKDKDGYTARELAYKRELSTMVHTIDSCAWIRQIKNIQSWNKNYLSLLPPELLELTSEYVI